MGNILASINAPSTVNTTQTPSLLQSLTGTGTALSGGLNALYGTSGANKILSSIGNSIPGLSSIAGNNNPVGDTSLPSNMTQEQVTAAQNGWVQQPDGSYLDSEGNPV
jgi:hypothetical protein